jgi:hypothetical protein
VTQVYAQRYSASGEQIGARMRLPPSARAQRMPHIAALPSGGFAIAWVQGEIILYIQQYTRDGALNGERLRVNDGKRDYLRNPSLVALRHGELAIAWQTDDGIYLRIWQPD